jgi:hypothetical protein
VNSRLTGEVSVTLHGARETENVIGDTLKKNDVERHEIIEEEKLR